MRRRGNSVLELLIVITVIAVFAVIGFMNLLGRRGSAEFDGTVRQMASVLREAQSRAMSQSSGTTWGVHFSNSTSGAFFAIFAGGGYSPSTQRGFHKVPNFVAYNTSSIAEGASKTVTFAQITGTTASTTIGLYFVTDPMRSSTIFIASSGAVSY